MEEDEFRGSVVHRLDIVYTSHAGYFIFLDFNLIFFQEFFFGVSVHFINVKWIDPLYGGCLLTKEASSKKYDLIQSQYMNRKEVLKYRYIIRLLEIVITVNEINVQFSIAITILYAK